MNLINVPPDGNCLLHSIALAFLDPSNCKKEFKRRFEVLFGTTFEEACDNLYQQFSGTRAIDANLYNDITSNQIWKTLIQQFRSNLITYMESNSHILSNSGNANGFIPNDDNFYNTKSFNNYLQFISSSCVWLGSLEIWAASLMLKCYIIVQQNNNVVASFNEQSSIILTLEFLKKGNHYNFILKCSPIPQQKRKCPRSETEFNKIYSDSDEIFKKRRKLDETIQDYKASGVKRALHGTIYQLELLILFLLRIEKLIKVFDLATEMDLADKFDDVVLKYRMKDNIKNRWRFLQAKHKQDPSTHKITITELKSSNDDDFSLQKYYLSFYKIKTNKYFQNTDLEDFCILTNTTFDLEERKTDRQTTKESKKQWKKLFSEGKDLRHDPILFFDFQESQEIKFKSEATEELGNIIKTSLSLAITTSINSDNKKKRLLNSKLLEKSTMIPAKIKEQIISLNTKYIGDSLLMAVLNIEENIKKFDKKSSKPQTTTKTQLVEAILGLCKSSKFDDLKQDLMNQMKISTEEKIDFLNQLSEHLREYFHQKKNLNDWFDSTKTQGLKEALENFDTYFPEFILKLRFITNYPNVDTLSSLISSEIGVDEKLLTPDLFAHSFKKIMLDWFKEKDGKFLSNKRRYEICNEIRVKIQTLMVTGLSKAYPEKLNSYGINFEQRISRIASFLDDINVSVLHLKSKNTLLTSIKLLQTLKQLSNFDKFQWINGEDSFIFIQIDTLLLPEIQKIVIHTFSSHLESQNLFIIECTSQDNKKIDLTILLDKLGKHIQKGNNKKVILIGSDEDWLIKKFKNSHNIKIDEFEDKTYFSHLDKISQENILSQQLALQGKDIQLRDITDKTMANDLINEAFLVDLIKKEPIIIGQALKPYFNYNDQYYILRKLQHQKLKEAVLHSGILLFVSNITEEQLIKLGAKKEELGRFKDYDILKNITFTESNKDSDTQLYFNELCRKEIYQNIHWIIFNKGYLEWKSSRGDVNNILEYVDPESNSNISANSLKEDKVSGLNVAENLVIIADSPGMGKSTLLASASLKIKENNPHWWIQVVSLNDYSDNNHPHALKNVNFSDDDLDAAVDYCSLLALPSDMGRFENKFIQRLFKESLLTAQLSKKLNIVMLFDGFDEIAPTFKRKTIKLLKSLRKTNIKQIWITTRLHIKQFLETELKFPALVLNPFTNLDKILFLNKFLKWHLKYREKDLGTALNNLAVIQNTHKMQSTQKHETLFFKDILALLEALRNNCRIEYIHFLIENLDPSENSWLLLLKWQKTVTKRKEDITSNPLHLKMLADVTFQRNENFNDNFNILSLYRSFVGGTFDVFFRDKKTVGGVLGGRMLEISSSMNFKKIHQELALKFFMSHVHISSLFSFLKNETDNFDQYNYGPDEPKIGIEQMLVRIGLVLFNSGSELTFVHATIAEYFLFEWLISHLQVEQVQEIFVKVILIEDDYSLTCEFFEIFLGNLVHPQTVIFSEKLVSAIWQNDIKTASHNTILHLATIRDHSNIINYLFENFENYDKKYLRDILIATNTQRQTALEIASIKKNVICFRKLLFLNGLYGKESLFFNLVSIIDNYLAPQDTEPDIQQNDNDTMIFKDLILFAKKELCAEHYKKLLLTPISGPYIVSLKRSVSCNILHGMVYYRQRSNLEFLLNELQHYPAVLKRLLMEKETGSKGMTPLYLALSKNYLEIIDLFVTTLRANSKLLSSMLLKSNNYGVHLQNKTILQNYKVFRNYLEIIRQYLSPAEYKRIISILVLSCNCQKETIFSILFNNQKDIEKDVLVTLLNKLDLEELCEDILLISIYFKGMIHEQPQNFLEWFQSSLAGTVHANNAVVSDTIQKVKKNISANTELTNYQQQIRTSTLKNMDTIFRDGTDSSILKNNEFLLSFKMDPFINTVDLLLQSCGTKLQEPVLNHLCDWPYILRVMVLDTDDSGYTILHKLVNKSKTEQTKMLLNTLSNFPDITENLILKVDTNENTAAHVAVANNNMEILEVMLNCTKSVGQDTLLDLIFAVNRKEHNILELAIQQKSEDIVKLIITFINLLKTEDLIDLIFATYKHTVNLIYFCLENGSREICTILFEFIYTILKPLGRSKVKQLFLETNHLPTINNHGNLIFAAAKQKEYLVLDILYTYIQLVFDNSDECKQFILSTDSAKHNFLHIAGSRGLSKNIEYFLEELRKSSDFEAVVSLLLNQNNSSNMTPLHYAIFHKKSEPLKIIFSFCENYLIHLYPNLLNQLLLTKGLGGYTILNFTVEKNSMACFTIVLSLVKVMEQKQTGILKELLLSTDMKNRTVLYNIILNENIDAKNMLDELLDTLDLFSMAVDDLILNEDMYGNTILHNTFNPKKRIIMFKKLFKKLRDRKILLKILTKENASGLTPLHKAYYSCDASTVREDAYVQFLLDEMRQLNLNEQTFLNLQKVSGIAEQFQDAIKSANLEKIKKTVEICHDCIRELFLMPGSIKMSSFLKAVYDTNNIDLVKMIFEFLYVNPDLLKHVFLSNPISFPACDCDFDVFSLIIEYAKSLNDNEFYRNLLLENNVILILDIRKGNKKIKNLMKGELNKIARSLLTSEGKLGLKSFTFRVLENLKMYVQSNEYTGSCQEELENIFREELFRRKSFNENSLVS